MVIENGISMWYKLNMKLDVYGRQFEVIRQNNLWEIYIIGEGRRSLINDICIPSDFTENEVVTFLEDLLHEIATPENSKIKKIE